MEVQNLKGKLLIQNNKTMNIKDLPEVKELDSKINYYVANSSDSYIIRTQKEVQNLFWKAIGAINKHNLTKDESKQPVKDYEILSVSNKHCGWTCDKSLFDWNLKNGWVISQVRRISDNEVFATGDKVDLGVIEKFFIGWAGMEVHFTDGCGARLQSIGHIKKEKLFVAEDGKEIFEGDEYWLVRLYDDAHYSKLEVSKHDGRKYDLNRFKRFSTEDKAYEYVLFNKPCLSLNDLLSSWCIGDMHKEDYTNAPLFLLFKELAKVKVNL